MAKLLRILRATACNAIARINYRNSVLVSVRLLQPDTELYISLFTTVQRTQKEKKDKKTNIRHKKAMSRKDKSTE